VLAVDVGVAFEQHLADFRVDVDRLAGEPGVDDGDLVIDLPLRLIRIRRGGRGRLIAQTLLHHVGLLPQGEACLFELAAFEGELLALGFPGQPLFAPLRQLLVDVFGFQKFAGISQIALRFFEFEPGLGQFEPQGIELLT